MESEIRSWLKGVLKEDIDDFSVKILGNSEKGDGYIGDIVFVSLIPANGKAKKEYELVLKCSKRSQTLREKAPVQDAFLNEIYVYDKIFPAFKTFQQEKGIQDVFNSIPSYLGKFTTEDMEVIVLENLKKIGYDLCNKKKPMTRKHIMMVIGKYAKFHSISIAMQDQQPQRFEELISKLRHVFDKFVEATDCDKIFGGSVDEISDLLKDDLDKDTLKIWQSLRENVQYIVRDMFEEHNGLRVILHGDCWCNNFMFKHDPENEMVPVNVAILDWQVSRYSSPILDLSYFLFSSISTEDMEDLVTILDHYYEQLKLNCERLSTNLEDLYSKNQFFQDWKKYCKFGILMASLIFKICVTEKDEVIDMGHAAENSEDFGTTFAYNVKNKNALRERSRHVVKYVTANTLV